MDTEVLQFSALLDPHTMLVPNSENICPLAYDDLYPFSEPTGNAFFQGNNLVVATGPATLFEVTDPCSGSSPTTYSFSSISANGSNEMIFIDTTAPGTTINFNNTGGNSSRPSTPLPAAST